MSAAYQIYQEQILDHYKNPRNKGILEPATLQGHESNPLCGDELTMYLLLDGQDRITDVRFNGQGCAISQASASMLTTMVKGKTVAEAKALGQEAILKALGIPLSAVRLKCALLSLQVLDLALRGRPASRGS